MQVSGMQSLEKAPGLFWGAKSPVDPNEGLSFPAAGSDDSLKYPAGSDPMNQCRMSDLGKAFASLSTWERVSCLPTYDALPRTALGKMELYPRASLLDVRLCEPTCDHDYLIPLFYFAPSWLRQLRSRLPSYLNLNRILRLEHHPHGPKEPSHSTHSRLLRPPDPHRPVLR